MKGGPWKARDPRNQQWLDLVRPIPIACGLYCIWANGKPLYIGTSQHLGFRLKSHSKRRAFIEAGADRITFELFHSHIRANRYDMELWLIAKHKPLMNRQSLRELNIEKVFILSD